MNYFVTGGAGFLGKFVLKKLAERQCKNVFVPEIEKYDLRNICLLYTSPSPRDS